MGKSLEGKTALVTGATRNLGRAIAERLAAEGALVAVNYAASDGPAQETLASIESSGGKAFLLKQNLGADGTAEALVKALVAELQKRTGSDKLDILVNNVGGGEYCDIHTTTPAEFDAIVSNNMRVPFFLTQALLPYLRDGGRIINLGSAASRLALPEVLVYSMVKAGVDVFTKCMAKVLGPRGITVNAVLPGFNETESNAREANDPELRKWVEDLTLLGRFGQPSDIADAVYAFASPELRWTTGQILEASGGFKF